MKLICIEDVMRIANIRNCFLVDGKLYEEFEQRLENGYKFRVFHSGDDYDYVPDGVILSMLDAAQEE